MGEGQAPVKFFIPTAPVLNLNPTEKRISRKRCALMPIAGGR